MAKLALITGAARGLGKAFANNLLSNGAKVCVVDRLELVGQQTVDEFKANYGEDSAKFLHCDVIKDDHFEDVFKKAKSFLGGLDLVVNNAGIIDERHWRTAVDVNLNAVIKGTLLGLHHMGKDQGNGGGHIINVASMAGLFPMSFGPVYTATKHGVVGLTRAWAAPANFARHGVRLNCLCPAFTNTDIIHIRKKQVVDLDDAQNIFKLLGVMQQDPVANAFMKLVQNDQYNGAVLEITHAKGTRQIKYPGEDLVETE